MIGNVLLNHRSCGTYSAISYMNSECLTAWQICTELYLLLSHPAVAGKPRFSHGCMFHCFWQEMKKLLVFLVKQTQLSISCGILSTLLSDTLRRRLLLRPQSFLHRIVSTYRTTFINTKIPLSWSCGGPWITFLTEAKTTACFHIILVNSLCWNQKSMLTHGICVNISACGVKPFGFLARGLLLCVQWPTLAKPLRILLFLLLLLSSGQLFHLKRRS